MLKETFLNKLKQRHPDIFNRYDYSSVPDEFRSIDKLPIKCLKHGFFQQLIYDHLNGHGCNKCGGSFKSNTEEFICKARLIHGDKYDYSKVVYVNSFTKVIIICKTHGEFLQTPSKHLNKRGCNKCSNNVKITNNNFIKKAIDIHGTKYTYRRTNYAGNKNKVIITCPIHGDFLQQAAAHLQGQGCPKCKASKGEKHISQVLDKYNIKYIREHRILPHRYFYDFYLPEYDIYIEYHGKQHYDPDEFFGGKDKFIKTQRNDLVKVELVKRSSGLLIVIKYTFNTIEKIEDELIRLFSYIHPNFLVNKEITKQAIIDSNVYLIEAGKVYKRK
jgi:hypothetical protein